MYQIAWECSKDHFLVLCRKHGISDTTFYKWRAKYGWLEVRDAKKLRQLEEENRRLKQMVAEQALDIQGLKALTAKLVGPQGEASGSPVSGRALWAESTAGVPARGARSKYLAVSESAP